MTRMTRIRTDQNHFKDKYQHCSEKLYKISLRSFIMIKYKSLTKSVRISVIRVISVQRNR